MSGEFWLGLDKINRLTRNKDMKLRVDLEYFEGKKRYAEYSTFVVEDENENYKFTVGEYRGKWNKFMFTNVVLLLCLIKLELILLNLSEC